MQKISCANSNIPNIPIFTLNSEILYSKHFIIIFHSKVILNLPKINRMDLPIAQKKEWAKLLYLKSELNQKEIAEKVGVAEKTLSKWVNDEHENWELLKSSFIITREQELRRIYIQISELNNSIANRDEGFRFSTPRDADVLSKLASAAKSLEAETSISDTISVFREFSEFLKEIDFSKAKEFIVFQDAFIKHKLSSH